MPFSTPVLDDVCVNWIRGNCSTEVVVLDIGAGAGKWRALLPEYQMDAVEAFAPTIEHFHLREHYREVFCQDVMTFKDFSKYGLVILGDVLEHLTVEDAQALLARLEGCKVVVKVPYLSPQGAINGNDYEIHRQPDLTTEVMLQRYPSLVLLATAPIFTVDTIAAFVRL